MATREENLKKINEQLEQIAGGIEPMWQATPHSTLNNETDSKMNPHLIVRMAKNMAIR